MARELDTAAPSRRNFLKTAGLFGGMAAAGWPALGHGQGLKTHDFIVPGGGAKVVQALAAGQVLFALGDSNHPLKITEKGKDALMIFATDTRAAPTPTSSCARSSSTRASRASRSWPIRSLWAARR